MRLNPRWIVVVAVLMAFPQFSRAETPNERLESVREPVKEAAADKEKTVQKAELSEKHGEVAGHEEKHEEKHEDKSDPKHALKHVPKHELKHELKHEEKQDAKDHASTSEAGEPVHKSHGHPGDKLGSHAGKHLELKKSAEHEKPAEHASQTGNLKGTMAKMQENLIKHPAGGEGGAHKIPTSAPHGGHHLALTPHSEAGHKPASAHSPEHSPANSKEEHAPKKEVAEVPHVPAHEGHGPAHVIHKP